MFPSNEATQNINIISNFQPDMTANFVPQDMSNELEKPTEEQKKSYATQRRLDETSNISTQRASEAFNLKGLQSSQLIDKTKNTAEIEAL